MRSACSSAHEAKMELLTNRNVAAVCVTGAAVSLAASLLFQSPAFSALSAAIFLLALLAWKFGYVLAPLLSGATGAWLDMKGFQLSPSHDAVVQKSGNSYTASVFLGVTLRQSSTDKSDPQRAMLMEYFERAISSVGYPVKICLMVCPLGTAAIEDDIKEKRSFAEERLSRLPSPSSGDATRLKRQIGAYDAMLSKITSGQRPMEVVAYLMASAKGITKQEAVSLAASRAGEIRAAFGNALDAEVRTLAGAELLNCIWWETSIPHSQHALLGELGG